MRARVAILAGLAALSVEAAVPTPSPYPPGADVKTLSRKGQAVGPLERLRVADKYTVFDFYADWCRPCRLVDAYLRDLLAGRADVAVRKLNVVDFDSPLAREMGRDFDSLPYVVVFAPGGARTDVTGFDPAALDAALGVK